MIRILIITLLSLLFVLFLMLSISYFSFVYVFKRRKREIDPYMGLDGEDKNSRLALSRKLIDDFIALKPTQEVYIKSHDGISLFGRMYVQDETAPFEIAFHGYRSIGTRDFSGGGEETLRRGHNLLLVDQRAHGKSEGKVISFGILERYDVLSWASYVREKYPENKIILLGISMGAASVLMASSLPLPDVSLILADAPYSAPCEIIKKVSDDMHIPSKLSYPFVRLGARLFGKFDLEECSPLSEVAHTSVPILIVHGEGDSFVPCEMSRRIKEKNENIVFESFPDAGHGLSYIFDTERYVRIMNSFIYKNLGTDGQEK